MHTHYPGLKSSNRQGMTPCRLLDQAVTRPFAHADASVFGSRRSRQQLSVHAARTYSTKVFHKPSRVHTYIMQDVETNRWRVPPVDQAGAPPLAHAYETGACSLHGSAGSWRCSLHTPRMVFSEVFRAASNVLYISDTAKQAVRPTRHPARAGWCLSSSSC